jgi:uncharacterized protein (TIGR02246 family)
MIMNQSRMKEFASRYAEAWCSQEPARVASFFAEDGSLKVNNGSPAAGRAAIASTARGFMTAFPDMVVKMDDLQQMENGFVFRWTLIGTNTGPGGTGKRVHISGYEEWTIGGEGLIKQSLGHFDEAEYERQLQFGSKKSKS